MNYRHAFHAGNFADVVKHAVVALIVERLKAKETAFRVIDTHAGIGIYDLSGTEAGKTGEWRDGIGRLIAADLAAGLAAPLASYLDAVRAINGDGPLTLYPGSPAIVHHLLRQQDRLTAAELHPEDAASLKARFAGDHQVRIVALDGWLALKAFVPPKERRGLVLVDPPFEEPGEFDRLLAIFLEAHRRWPTGIYALWYPLKDIAATDQFRAGLAASGVPRLVGIELAIRRRDMPGLLNGCGMILVNPPYGLAETLRPLLAGLTDILGREPGAGWRIDEIASERRA